VHLWAVAERQEDSGHLLHRAGVQDDQLRAPVGQVVSGADDVAVAFLGAARYDLATPAYGFYYGLGLQWRDVLPHVDVGVEARYYDSVARDHVLPSDPHTTRPDSFYDISGAVLSLTYHF